MIASIGSSMAYEFRSPMIRKSGSPLPVGSVASQSTSASAAALRVRLQLPWPSPVSGSPIGAAGALRLEVVDDDREAGAGGDLLERLGERRAAPACR